MQLGVQAESQRSDEIWWDQVIWLIFPLAAWTKCIASCGSAVNWHERTWERCVAWKPYNLWGWGSLCRNGISEPLHIWLMVLIGFISIIHRVHPCNCCTLLQGGTKIPEFPSVIIWMLFLPDFCTNAFDQGLKQLQLAYISVLSSHSFPVVCQAYLDLNC